MFKLHTGGFETSCHFLKSKRVGLWNWLWNLTYGGSEHFGWFMEEFRGMFESSLSFSRFFHYSWKRKRKRKREREGKDFVKVLEWIFLTLRVNLDAQSRLLWITKIPQLSRWDSRGILTGIRQECSTLIGIIWFSKCHWSIDAGISSIKDDVEGRRVNLTSHLTFNHLST